MVRERQPDVLRRALATFLFALIIALGPDGFLIPSKATATAGAATQSINFVPPYTAVVDDIVTLRATASSGLPVSFSTGTPDICSVSEALVTMLQAGSCSVTATQAGNDRFAAATKTETIDVSAVGYRAAFTITAPNGVQRSGNRIFVGDRLDIHLTPDSGQSLQRCLLQVSSFEAGMMQFNVPADSSGACTASLTIPEVSEFRKSRTELISFPRELDPTIDVCIAMPVVYTSTGLLAKLRAADRTQPGGLKCQSPWSRADEYLDFAFDGTGDFTVPFESDPHVLSWDMKDWSAETTDLAFNTDLTIKLPAWVTSCYVYLNGSWQTSIAPKQQTGCPVWNLHLPGVLPAATPWGGQPFGWETGLVMYYAGSDGVGQFTDAYQYIPYAPSDGIFRSSIPAVYPTDLATARFVTLGDVWTPTFHVTGGGDSVPEVGTVCRLRIWAGSSWFRDWPQRTGPDDDLIEVARVGTDVNGDCAFSVPVPYTGTDQNTQRNQYFLDVADSSFSYNATISAVPPLTPPTIPDPVTNNDRSTDVAVNPGDGNGMSLQVEVTPEVAPAISARQHNLLPARAVAAEVPGCSAVAYTPNLASGGAVPQAKANCKLASGRYVVTARMVDVTGKVQTTTRTVTVSATSKQSLTGIFVARANGNAAGAAVTYSLAGTTVALDTIGQAGGGTITYAESDPDCSISGSTLKIVQVGDGSCVVTATIAESGAYLSASDTVTVSISKATAALTFTPPANVTYGVAPFRLVASTSNTDSNAVTFTVAADSSAVCSVSGSTLTVIDGGTCSITASRPETANYLAAPSITRSFTVNARAAATVKPSISGTATVGLTLTADQGTWTGYPTPTVAYRWYACSQPLAAARSSVPSNCSAVPGGTTSTLALTSSHAGKYITVRVTGTSAPNAPTSWLSVTTPAVVARAQATVKPALSGTAKVGSTLTARQGTWAGYPTPTFAYQWYACTSAINTPAATVPGTCVAISGAVSSTFKVTAAQRAKYIAVLVTGTSAGTASTAWLSKSTAVVR